MAQDRANKPNNSQKKVLHKYNEVCYGHDYINLTRYSLDNTSIFFQFRQFVNEIIWNHLYRFKTTCI